MLTDHEAALRDAQEAVEEERPRWDAVLDARRVSALAARADDVSIYRIAKILGLKENTVRQILGLPRAKRSKAERDATPQP